MPIVSRPAKIHATTNNGVRSSFLPSDLFSREYRVSTQTYTSPHVVTYSEDDRPSWSWRRINIKLILFNLFVMPLLGLLYWQINSIGLRLAIPQLGAKLHKFVLFTWMRRYQGWKEFDWANIGAIAQLAVVWAATLLLMRVFVYGTIPGKPINEQFVRRFILIAGTILLVWDATMFYKGISDYGWMGGNGGVTTVIVTIGWMTALLILAFIETMLQRH